MNTIFKVLLLFCGIVTNAQDVVGTYQLHSSSSEHELKRTLTLNADGTFEYYNFRRIEKGIPKETHTYGKGSWIKDKKVIVFSTEDSELDNQFTLNFTGTKARFISKSPRDKSDRIIKTALSFYESDIFWVTGMTLIKL